jgi:hypothetical protein
VSSFVFAPSFGNVVVVVPEPHGVAPPLAACSCRPRPRPGSPQTRYHSQLFQRVSGRKCRGLGLQMWHVTLEVLEVDVAAVHVRGQRAWNTLVNKTQNPYANMGKGQHRQGRARRSAEVTCGRSALFQNPKTLVTVPDKYLFSSRGTGLPPLRLTWCTASAKIRGFMKKNIRGLGFRRALRGVPAW